MSNHENHIVSESFHVVPESGICVCVLQLDNGLLVVGHPDVVNPNTFDAEACQREARENAVNNIPSALE